MTSGQGTGGQSRPPAFLRYYQRDRGRVAVPHAILCGRVARVEGMLLHPPSFLDTPHTLATESLIGINSHVLPLASSLSCRGRAYLKSCRSKICDRTAMSPWDTTTHENGIYKATG
jgi:hypothetical protein